MNEQIEMRVIQQQSVEVGTEIMDANLPSNIDFEQSHINESTLINPQTAMNAAKKSLLQANIESYRVKGACKAAQIVKFKKGDLVRNIPALQVKVTQSNIGFKNMFSNLLGYDKKYTYISEGYLYIFNKKKQGFELQQFSFLGHLFKIFIDLQEEQIRLVFRQNQKLTIQNIKPIEFQLFIQMIRQEVKRIGLYFIE